MNEEPLRRSRHRRLSEAERTLWSEVTRDIVPLRRFRSADDEPAEAAAASPKPAVEIGRATQNAVSADRPRTAAPPLASLGRRLRHRIARGSYAIGGRVDLHGLTQREAHAVLFDFLHNAQARGAGIVLVITGKGSPEAEAGGGRGVLRRQVPLWLRLPQFRDLVAGFEPAHVTHGGEGAFYVRLRRKRR